MHGARMMGWLVMLALAACVDGPKEDVDSDTDGLADTSSSGPDTGGDSGDPTDDPDTGESPTDTDSGQPVQETETDGSPTDSDTDLPPSDTDDSDPHSTDTDTDSDTDLPPVDSDTDIPERPYFDPPAGQSACVLTPEAPTMADTMTVTSTGLTDPDPTDGVAVDVRYEWWVYEHGTLNHRRDPRGNEANALGSTAPPWGATRPSCDDANFPLGNINDALSCRVGSVLYAKCIAFDAFGDGEVALSAEITIVAP